MRLWITLGVFTVLFPIIMGILSEINDWLYEFPDYLIMTLLCDLGIIVLTALISIAMACAPHLQVGVVVETEELVSFQEIKDEEVYVIDNSYAEVLIRQEQNGINREKTLRKLRTKYEFIKSGETPVLETIKYSWKYDPLNHWFFSTLCGEGYCLKIPKGTIHYVQPEIPEGYPNQIEIIEEVTS